jgi:hypothetical protein
MKEWLLDALGLAVRVSLGQIIILVVVLLALQLATIVIPMGFGLLMMLGGLP